MKTELLFCLFIIFISFSLTPYAEEKRTIVIDPGHGGMDGGTSYNDILEKDINLLISLKLKNALEDEGYNVILTRDCDISLTKNKFIKKEDMINKVNIINQSKAYLPLLIHLNFFSDERYSGS